MNLNRLQNSIRFAKSALFALALLRPAALRAQEIRGTVYGADNVPVAGVVLLLIHETINDSIVARTISSERGTFSLKAPKPVSVRLRALRIGYEPTDVGVFLLTTDPLENLRVQLSQTHARMSVITVDDKQRCEVQPSGARVVAQLFLEARTALLATTVTAEGSDISTQYTNYSRHEDLNGRLTKAIDRTTYTGASVRAYGSLAADSLSRYGYIVNDRNGISTYYAPDAMVLLSSVFASQHCLQLVEGTGEHSGALGIGFRPVNRPKRLVDVSGTLWLNRETKALQLLEFDYVPVAEPMQKLKLGGRVEYTQMGDGTWIVSRWSIRMPQLMMARRVGRNFEMGVQSIGGEVQNVMLNGDALYVNSGAIRAGSEARDLPDVAATTRDDAVKDSVPSAPGAPPAVSVCGNPGVAEGLVSGQVLSAEMKPLAGIDVTVMWTESIFGSGATGLAWKNRELVSKTDENGMYLICGFPVRQAVSLSAKNGESLTRAVAVRITETEPIANMDLAFGTNSRMLKALAQANAKKNTAALYVTNINGLPVPYASVSANGTVDRITDADGLVILKNISEPAANIVVRKLGYAPFEGRLERNTTFEPFRLTVVPVAQDLKTINVRDRQVKSPLELSGFYDRMLDTQRGTSTGDFYTPEMLNARSVATVTQLLEGTRYASVKHSGRSTVVTGRSGCLMTIVLDGQRMNDHDVNALVGMSSVTAIEVYPSLADAPASIASKVRSTTCGIVAIWTGGR